MIHFAHGLGKRLHLRIIRDVAHHHVAWFPQRLGICFPIKAAHMATLG